MNYGELIQRIGETAAQYPHLDFYVRDIVDQAIKDIQRAHGTWSFLKTETTAVVNAGDNQGVFTNTNEYRGLQSGGASPVSVDDTGTVPTSTRRVEVMTRGEIERLNSRYGFGSHAYNSFTGLQEPVYITRTASLAGQINLINDLDSARTYNIKAYIMLPSLSATTDTNVLIELYPDLIIAKARASMLSTAGQYELAQAERAMYKEMLVDAIRQDAYAGLNGQPVRM